tara:strand:- start:67 stop:345 length:279 start_codon:yes stop_codon:yes gene_type:complete
MEFIEDFRYCAIPHHIQLTEDENKSTQNPYWLWYKVPEKRDEWQKIIEQYGDIIREQIDESHKQEQQNDEVTYNDFLQKHFRSLKLGLVQKA